MQQKIIILDFGSQTTQLIGRRVRELDTFCEILPYNKFPKDDPSVIGVILSGSPYSVHDPEAFKVDLSQFVGKIPVLGICYGRNTSHTLVVARGNRRVHVSMVVPTWLPSTPRTHSLKASNSTHRYGCRMAIPSQPFLPIAKSSLPPTM